MYTKQEISRQKQSFWTAFGKYMKPILSSDGGEVSWINYKTGNKYIGFRMEADSRRAVISVIMDDPDPGSRQLYFNRFLQLKALFEGAVGEGDWVWRSADVDEHGRNISTIYKELTGVNIFQNDTWPAIISFLKPRIIALDEFWSMARDQFSDI